jgi:hypothetical protein
MKRKQQGLLNALEHFDALPDSAYIPGVAVDVLMGYSRWTRIRQVKNGALCAPEQLSPGVQGFNVGKIRKVLAQPGARAVSGKAAA